MMTRREMMKTMAGSTAIAAQLFGALALAEAAEGGAKEEGKVITGPGASDKGVTVRALLQHDLPDAPGKQLSVVTVEFEPGAASSPRGPRAASTRAAQWPRGAAKQRQMSADRSASLRKAGFSIPA